MKVLLINGSPHEAGSTFTALNEMIKVFEAEGIGTELIQLGKQDIRGCIACGGCEERCPFGVKVTERMEKAAEVFGL